MHTERAADHGDQHDEIGRTGEWIRAIDHKAAIIGTFAVAVAAGLLGTKSDIKQTLSSASDGTRGMIGAIGFGVAVLFLALAVVFAALVIWPRTDQPDSPNPLAFPSVAAGDMFSWRHRRGQCVAEHRILSEIAILKCRYVKCALSSLIVSFGAFAVWRIALAAS